MIDTKVAFESTSTMTQITKWYTVEGAPIIETSVNGRTNLVRNFSPMSVRFIFVNDRCTDVFINAHTVRLSGEISERVMSVPDISVHDKRNWPEWLHELYKLAQPDLQTVLV